MPSPSDALCSLPFTANGHGNASGNGNGSSVLSPNLNVTVNLFSKTTVTPPKRSFDSTAALVAVGAGVVGGIVVAATMKYGENKHQEKQPVRVELSLDQTLASQLMGTARQNRF